jgi:glycosyltransferase involved in cell wall biosynthesis
LQDLSPPTEPALDLRPSFTLVLPVFNEAALLAANLATLINHMQGLADRYRWEFLIVDDGSTDGSADIATEFAARTPGVRVIRHPRNFRIGQALRFAFPQCKTDYVVTFDADLSYSPDHIERMLDALRTSKARVVVASPYMPGGQTSGIPGRRLFVSKAANRFLSLMSKSSVRTVTGLVRAYDRRFLDSLNLKAMDNEINAEIIYKSEILRAGIIEIPAHLDWSHLPDRRSAGMRFRRITLGFAFTGYLFRPFMFFMIPGLLSLAFSAILSFLLVTDILGGQAAIYATLFSFIVAVQLIVGGLVSAQNKRYFEEMFHMSTSIRRSIKELTGPESLVPPPTAEFRAPPNP